MRANITVGGAVRNYIINIPYRLIFSQLILCVCERRLLLFVTVGDTAFAEIIWRELDIDAVAHQDTDAVSAHAS